MRYAASREVFTLIAEMAPPVVSGHDYSVEHDEQESYPLQATSVQLDGDTAVVSYHRRGEVYAGASDVFDVSDPENPELTASARLDHMDINAVTYGNGKGTGSGYIYLSASSCDPLFHPWTAVAERMRLEGYQLTIDENYRFGLPGRVGTGAAVDGSLLFATSGTGGGLLIADPETGERIEELPIDSARWVDVQGEYVAVAEGGEGGGALTVIRSSSGGVETIPFPGAEALESKTTVELAAHRAFVAAGAEGMHMIDLNAGEVVATIGLPTDGPVDLDYGATNAASVDGDLVFLANGGYGVALVRASHKLRPPSSEEPALELIGTLRLGTSANHVAYRQGLLFVAAGNGGLNILSVDEKR